MNGFEFVREARKIDPKVKILLMTAFEIDDKDLAKVLPKPKINGLLRKPASTKQILNTISNLIMDLWIRDVSCDHLDPASDNSEKSYSVTP